MQRKSPANVIELAMTPSVSAVTGEMVNVETESCVSESESAETEAEPPRRPPPELWTVTDWYCTQMTRSSKPMVFQKSCTTCACVRASSSSGGKSCGP